MRVGFVASELEGERTGVGRFLEGLLGGLLELGCDDEYVLFLRGRALDHPLCSDERIRPVFSRRDHGSAVLWEQLSLPRRLGELDAIVGPAYSLPPTDRYPSMVFLHDLSFEVRPQDFGWRERWRRRFLARRAAARASRVATLSGAVARDIVSRYGVDAAKVFAVPLAVDARFRQARCADADPPYLLYLGSVLPRRRIDLVLESFARLAPRHPRMRLVIAGANRLREPASLASQVDRLGIAHRVETPGYVAEGELPSLIAGAVAAYYLSEYEGYGLPPLEALAAGTPVIVSSGLALDDLWPDYPLRCPLGIDAVASCVERAVEDPELRQRVREESLPMLRRLSWRATASRVRQELVEIAECA